jgi:hypothetical protein
MSTKSYDPRSEAEKARADLARNSEMGAAVPQSEPERRPSVTQKTFADTTENARAKLGTDGLEAGGPQGEVGDSTGTAQTSRDIPERNDSDEDILSRAKE